MMVVFHAIVPLETWEWDDESEIYIRFGHPKFGNWNYDAGPGRRTWYSLFVCVCVVHYMHVSQCGVC